MANLWYLSPSNQQKNVGIGSYGTEAEQMYLLCDAITPHLDRCGVQFTVADFDTPISNRPSQANKMKADYYLALHSNAGGNGGAWGPVAYYHTAGLPLAEALIKELLATGQKTNRWSNIYQKKGLIETRGPVAPAVLLEVDFHDSKTGVDFLMNRRADAAKAIAKAIVTIDGKSWTESPASAQSEAQDLGIFPAGDINWDVPITKGDAAKALVNLFHILKGA